LEQTVVAKVISVTAGFGAHGRHLRIGQDVVGDQLRGRAAVGGRPGGRFGVSAGGHGDDAGERHQVQNPE